MAWRHSYRCWYRYWYWPDYWHSNWYGYWREGNLVETLLIISDQATLLYESWCPQVKGSNLLYTYKRVPQHQVTKNLYAK